jgi:pilus assembly protein Flp/PilA
MKFIEHLRRLACDSRGATAIEYGLILAMVFLAMVGAVVALGQEDESLYDHVSSTAVGAMRGAV